MYFTPEEIAILEESSVYKTIKRTGYTSLSVTTLQAYLDGISVVGAKELPLIRYIILLLKSKQEEANLAQFAHLDDIETEIKNQPALAAIVNAGGDPLTAHYPQKQLYGTRSVAGGAGAIAAWTFLAAVTGKKIFIEELNVTLSTDTASGGIMIEVHDGAGGSTVTTFGLSINQPNVTVTPNIALTSATLMELQGIVADFAALDDNDTVFFNMKYREI